MRRPVFEHGTKAVLEQYVIRIYRRHALDADAIVGVVQEVGSDRERRFGSFAELQRILFEGQARPPRGKSQLFRKTGRRPASG